MATDVGEIWRNCFRQWPAEIERRGVLVTSFGEQIVFDGFATSDDLLLVERRTPDTVGARTVLVVYQNIQAVKIVDVVKTKAFHALGFTAPAPAARKA
jgi:hypothetical protein